MTLDSFTSRNSFFVKGYRFDIEARLSEFPGPDSLRGNVSVQIAVLGRHAISFALSRGQ